MKHDAIYKLNPNIKSIVEDLEGNLVAYDINKNEITLPNSSDIENKVIELSNERETKKQAEENAKVSGNQKLLDLGLTQAEATALTGYTPPVAE